MIKINLSRFFLIHFKPTLKIHGCFNQNHYDKNTEIKIKTAKQTIFCHTSSNTKNTCNFNAEIPLQRRFSFLRIKVSPPHKKSFSLRKVFIIHLGKKLSSRSLQPQTSNKKNILVVCHEVSLTGAPLIGKKLSYELNKSFNVFLWVGKILDNSILPQFEKHCCQIFEGFHNSKYIAKKLPKLEFAIFNSIITAAVVRDIKPHTKTIMLIHEFSYFCSQMITNTQNIADITVFPSVKVQQSYTNFPLKKIFTQPQGFLGFNKDGDFDSTYLDKLNQENTKFVLSCGTICSRKGYDIFLQTAQKYRQNYPQEKVIFIWMGSKDQHNPEYNLWQEVYSNLVQLKNICMIPAQKNPENFFHKADVFYMCSRLDPCPNVVIEAMHCKKPIVLFDEGCGSVDFFPTDSQGAKIIPYLDVEIAAKTIQFLLNNPSLCKSMGDRNHEYVRENLNFSDYAKNLKEIAET
ncbi:glycosyltransferase family 4 protein [Candidatus Uabimicrobium sp. HlEnr_7]|uniref:glycosyltransferase family 4 protein n=1 Tax=Candidatus Uabimicrobium helgolandensis TaxID=3095367 RepID=UPI0035581070